MSKCVNHQHEKTCLCEPVACVQTLDDMEFERGIWHAAQSGDTEGIEKLVKRGGVDALDGAGYTALHHAARGGHADVCRQLIRLGASLDAKTRAFQATPLHRAASAGHEEVVEIFLKAGADASLKDGDGQSALHRAAAAAHLPVVRLLLKFDKKSISEVDNRGRLPIHLVQTSSAPDPELLNLLK